ncbi:MAG: FKBP-type peptidyl-prolyl cis-trans isomerase [Candidatus Saccharimonadales bacterium]|nr:FKBP-type peptidyl-prolyl cis-trans isomerase FkpA [Patescibacteria group bacterium]
MATSTAQRAGIWIIAIVLTVGTIGGFLVMILAPQNEASDAERQQKEFAKMIKQQQEQQQKASEPLDGYRAEPFDAESVKELKVETLVEGSGEQLTKDSTISANYFGWTSDGKIFDSSKKSGTVTPAEFSLQGVIPGWTEGLTGAKVGSTVKLTIPAEKAYGSTDDGMGRPVGPLQFIVEIKELK